MAEINLPDIRILIAEDEDDLRELLVSVFESRGSQVYSAKDGLEALDVMKRNPVDIILSDVRMPRCDGIKLMGEVRRNQNLNPIIYLVTGYADINPDEVMDGGADKLIHKPFSIEELFQMLENHLDERNSIQALTD